MNARKSYAELVSDLRRALVKPDAPGDRARKEMHQAGGVPTPDRLPQQKGSTAWCPTCKQYHRVGTACPAVAKAPAAMNEMLAAFREPVPRIDGGWVVPGFGLRKARR